MKRALYYTALFLVLAVCLPVECFSGGVNLPAEADAQVLDARRTWDFGSVKEAEVVKHDFTLKNDSERILNITGVDTSCGCTVSDTQDTNLASGEETLIEVSFDSKGYSGPVSQYVYVNTDSLEEPVIRFTIKANVVKK